MFLQNKSETRMRSCRKRTVRSFTRIGGSISVTDTPWTENPPRQTPPGQRTPWTENSPGQRPVGQRIPPIVTPWKGNSLDRNPTWTDKHFWKHYLSTTSFAGGKIFSTLFFFMDSLLLIKKFLEMIRDTWRLSSLSTNNLSEILLLQ